MLTSIDTVSRLVPSLKRAMERDPLLRALKGVRAEVALARRHWRGVVAAGRLVSVSEIKINIGCGPNLKTGWVNADLWSRRPEVLTLDLRRDLPFRDACAAMIYGEHVFEHLEYPMEAQHFLREAWRVLKSGGVLSLGVPDAEASLRDYVDGDDAPFAYAREHWHPTWCDTHMHQVNYLFRQGSEHKYAYDYETLTSVLRVAGFGDVVRRDWDAGIDSEERRIATLYVAATKVPARC
jgi:predicted SAM-dependent methyltransferase